LFVDCVGDLGGNEASAAVLAAGGFDPDEEVRMDRTIAPDRWLAMLSRGLEVLGVTPEEGEAAFAEYFYQDAKVRWPVWFGLAKDSRDFLEMVPRIHNSLATGTMDPGHRGRASDKFKIERVGEDEIVTHYTSPNGHCGLYLVLARKILAHFGDEGTVTETRCRKHGDDECEIHIRWTRLGEAS
jgi:hypothetical protein